MQNCILVMGQKLEDQVQEQSQPCILGSRCILNAYNLVKLVFCIGEEDSLRPHREAPEFYGFQALYSRWPHRGAPPRESGDVYEMANGGFVYVSGLGLRARFFKFLERREQMSVMCLESIFV